MSKSNGCNRSSHPRAEHNRQEQSSAYGSDNMDNLKKDRWELLNAYLDSEVTPQEKRMVEGWLREDKKMQCLYARLLQIRCGIQSLPVPPTGKTPDDIAQAVCKRIERRPQRRKLIWIGAAIAAFFGTVLTSNMGQVPLAPSTNQVDGPTELNIKLDETLLPLPFEVENGAKEEGANSADKE